MPETSTAHRRYPIRVAEDVGVLRRGVAAEAARLEGLSASDAELVATEVATNVLRHATGGHVLTRPVDGGIELIAADHGPGLPPNVIESLTVPPPTVIGGTSPTAGGLGVGLAGVRRRTSTFDCLDAAIQDLRTAIFGLLQRQQATSLHAQLDDLIRQAEEGLGFRPTTSLRGPIDAAVPITSPSTWSPSSAKR